MSVPRCGVCSAPTMTGSICLTHWGLLGEAIEGAGRVLPILELGPARGVADEVRGSSVPGMVMSPAIVEARAAITDAVNAALRAAIRFRGSVVPRDGLRLLQVHRGALRGSWAAPVLMVDLTAAVQEGWRAVEKPRGRMTVPVNCSACGPSTMHMVGGLLECGKCSARITIAEARDAR